MDRELYEWRKIRATVEKGSEIKLFVLSLGSLARLVMLGIFVKVCKVVDVVWKLKVQALIVSWFLDLHYGSCHSL